MNFTISGQWVDLEQQRIIPARIEVVEGRIASITELKDAPDQFLLPGFVDAHVHIESSLLVPSEFARMAVLHGTVATVSDPHEIANVLGMKGVEFMLDNARQAPFWFYFGAPSCVPATSFETAGATMESAEVAALLDRPEIKYLSEMMNFPGVINRDPEVLRKIAAAHERLKPVDGHAPGLRGEALKKYLEAGISTDHECFTIEEAVEKIALGMRVLIREGSAARNFDTLVPLFGSHPEALMFCSDDKHPDSLEAGHINQLVARAVALGYDVFDVLRAACLHPVMHYQLDHGCLRPGDSADFIVVNNLKDFLVNETYIKGNCVARDGKSLIPSTPVTLVNNFVACSLTIDQLKRVPADPEPVIVCLDGQLITMRESTPAAEVLPENDCLKMVVVNRYHQSNPAVCYLKNFGLKSGAIAGSVAHDSHNVIAVGYDDNTLLRAIQLVMQEGGALAACDAHTSLVLPLPVAGLMSPSDAWEVSEKYQELDRFTRITLGSGLRAPFMTLSFMALLVIPHLKLSDKGLFDVDQFAFLQ